MKLFVLFLCFISSSCGNHYYDQLWDQPCIDDNSVPSPGKSAEEVAMYSEWILEQLGLYKDMFIEKLEKHHSTFEEVAEIAKQEKKEWLRNFNWFIDEILPHNKLLGEQLPENTIRNLTIQIKYFDKLNSVTKITKLNAVLYFILGTIFEITKMPVNADIMDIDLDFKRTITESIRIIRSIICSMNNYMKSKDHQIEIPEILPKNLTHSEVGLVLVDTFNYFEYIKQLFEAFKIEEDLNKDVPYELELWANPCNYPPPADYDFDFNNRWDQNTTRPDPEKAKELAPQIMRQAAIIFNDGLKFKDEYAQFLTNYSTFDEALHATLKDEWLRKYQWFQDEVLPKNKKLFFEIEFRYISRHLMKVFPKVLPLMYKGAKMILSGLNRILNLKVYKKGLQPDFQSLLEVYKNKVKKLVCLLSEFLRARGKFAPKQVWLFAESRISERWVFPIYRDSLLYLSYINEVFDFIARHQARGQNPYLYSV